MQQGLLYPGIQFEPTDEEIVGYFLTLVAGGSEVPVPAANFIRQVAIYGDQPPWEIFADEFPGKTVFYAMTRLTNASEKRVNRRAGGGTWKGQSIRTEIRVGGEVVGEKYTLSYMLDEVDGNAEQKKKKKVTTHWNMTEYRLLNYKKNQQEYVFCRIVYSGKLAHYSSVSPSLISGVNRTSANVSVGSCSSNHVGAAVGHKRERMDAATTPMSLLPADQTSQYYSHHHPIYLASRCTFKPASEVQEEPPDDYYDDEDDGPITVSVGDTKYEVCLDLNKEEQPAVINSLDAQVEVGVEAGPVAEDSKPDKKHACWSIDDILPGQLTDSDHEEQ